jgi:hypothetical protein
MGLFDNIFRLNREETSQKDETMNFSVPSVGYGTDSSIKITENKSESIYNFGQQNQYPRKLIDLYDNSPTNQAIINRTSLMIAGGQTEVEFISDDVMNAVHVIALQKHPNSKQNIEQILNQVSFDLKLHGRYAIECIWNEKHDKVVQLKRVDVEGVRVGLMEDGVIKKLYYSEDWKNRKCPRIEYQPFDKYGDQNRQLFYVQMMRSGHSVYGLPDYYASMRFIELEKEIGIHYLDSAQNGFSPKMSVVFSGKPESEEIEDRIMSRLNQHYTGTLGKKIIGVFSPRPEVKPEFNPISVDNIDKQYSVIDEQTQNKILTGHGVVSPMLFGIKTAGQLGGANELETAFNIYQSSVVSPYQDMIQRSLNEILEASGNPNRIKMTEFKIMVEPNIEIDEDGGANKVTEALNSMSPLVASKVLDNLTPNEIRSLGGLPSIKGGELVSRLQPTEQNIKSEKK